MICTAREYPLDVDDIMDLDDRRREAPGSFYESEDKGRYLIIDSPFDATKTPIKASVDYQLEALVAKAVVEYLGHWPETPFELEDAYKGITSL